MDILSPKDKLASLGVLEADVDKIINDVHEVITGKIVLASIQKAGSDVQEAFNQLSVDQQKAYIQAHETELPHLNPQEIAAIIESTWEDYFTYMQSKK